VPGRYRPIDYGEDIRAFIDGVIGEPAIVHGFSLGGLVAVYLAAKYPALVRALILEEPPLWDTTPVGVLDYFKRCHELASLGKSVAELREILQPQNTWDRTYALRLSQLDPGTVAVAIGGSGYEGYESEALLKRIACPVQLIYGDPAKGSVLTPEQLEVIRSSIPDCVADFVDAGHTPRAEQPMQTVSLLLRFLESL
jgi:pimeloyl-ACP methyl ester carboxylesterase